jgi:hypothetical protein
MKSTSVVVDRALLITGLVHARSASLGGCNVLQTLSKDYDQILYEPRGVSALRSIFPTLIGEGTRCVAINVLDEVDLGSVGIAALREWIVSARQLKNISAIIEEQRLLYSDWNDAQADELLEYSLRLALIARKLQADVAVAALRFKLLTCMFETVADASSNSLTTISLEPLAHGNVRLVHQMGQRGAEGDRRKRIFISYSHLDQRWLELLLTHLQPFARKEDIKVWSDRDLPPAALWEQELNVAISAASVAVPIVSANYLASEYVTSVELPALVAAVPERGLRLVWFLASAAAFDKSPLAKIQAAHTPLRPLDSVSVPRRNQVMTEIARSVEAALMD